MISHFAYGIFCVTCAFCLTQRFTAKRTQCLPQTRPLVSFVSLETEAKLLTAVVVDFPHFVRFTQQQQKLQERL